MTVPETLVAARPVDPRNPFAPGETPLIARLYRWGFHVFRRRWTKRLLKKPARRLFDFAYRGLGLGGAQTMSLGLPGGPVLLRFDARRVNVGGVLMPQHAFGPEPEVSALLEMLLTGERVFYDVGSNWGYFSLVAAGLPAYAGPIHAFEPVPATFADVSGLVTQAGLAGRVACHNLALSDRTGEGTMAVGDVLHCGWDRVVEGGEGIRIQLRRLDDLGLPPPDLVKVDVEEHELQVFRGGGRLLAERKPYLVFENWLSRKDPEASLKPLRHLEGEGYVLFLPCWHAGGGTGHLAYAYDPRRAGVKPALTRIAADTRPFLKEQVNLFACHRDRLGDLARDFAGMPARGAGQSRPGLG